MTSLKQSASQCEFAADYELDMAAAIFEFTQYFSPWSLYQSADFHIFYLFFERM